MKRIYILTAFISFILTTGFTSCDSKLDLTNPSKATSATFWKSEKDFSLAMTSCYTPLKNGLNGGYYGTRGVMLRIARSDEVVFRNDISAIYQVHRFTNSNTNKLVEGMFYQINNALYRTNSIFQRIDQTDFSDDFKNSIKGECSFIRGFYLFILGKEFKDAPLRLTASQDSKTFPLAKSSQEEIYNQALKDLQTASELLPLINDIGKPTKGAALATMGKIYVYMKQWKKAEQTLTPLTKSPYTYKLVEDYEWNFDEAQENNQESIFELLIENVGGDNIWGNGEMTNSTQTNTRPKEYAAPEIGGWYEATPSEQAMRIFKEEKDKDGNYDYRARMSVAWNYSGCMYYQKPFQEIFRDKLSSTWILKYQNWQTQTDEPNPPKSSINERAIRYADVILLLAESHLEMENLAQAVTYINQIRERANLNDYSGPMTKEGIKADLIHQRAVEFFVEGERFYDLRRWGLLKEKLKEADVNRAANFSDKFYYFPIPAKELQTNSLCTPSEGW